MHLHGSVVDITAGAIPPEYNGAFVLDVHRIEGSTELPRIGDQIFQINSVDTHSWSVRQVASALSKARDNVELQVAMNIDALEHLKKIYEDEEEIGEMYKLVCILKWHY